MAHSEERVRVGTSTAVKFRIRTTAGGGRVNSPRFRDMVRSAALIQMSALDVPSYIIQFEQQDMHSDRIRKFGG